MEGSDPNRSHRWTEAFGKAVDALVHDPEIYSNWIPLRDHLRDTGKPKGDIEYRSIIMMLCQTDELFDECLSLIRPYIGTYFLFLFSLHIYDQQPIQFMADTVVKHFQENINESSMWMPILQIYIGRNYDVQNILAMGADERLLIPRRPYYPGAKFLVDYDRTVLQWAKDCKLPHHQVDMIEYHRILTHFVASRQFRNNGILPKDLVKYLRYFLY